MEQEYLPAKESYTKEPYSCPDVNFTVTIATTSGGGLLWNPPLLVLLVTCYLLVAPLMAV